ncbi:MAG TPA: hypothetical protein VM537_34780 [Anaerolineae bacterium]|nr:hypothetical protein [Anaerolineae bacterium]
MSGAATPPTFEQLEIIEQRKTSRERNRREFTAQTLPFLSDLAASVRAQPALSKQIGTDESTLRSSNLLQRAQEIDAELRVIARQVAQPASQSKFKKPSNASLTPLPTAGTPGDPLQTLSGDQVAQDLRERAGQLAGQARGGGRLSRRDRRENAALERGAATSADLTELTANVVEKATGRQSSNPGRRRSVREAKRRVRSNPRVEEESQFTRRRRSIAGFNGEVEGFRVLGTRNSVGAGTLLGGG